MMTLDVVAWRKFVADTCLLDLSNAQWRCVGAQFSTANEVAYFPPAARSIIREVDKPVRGVEAAPNDDDVVTTVVRVVRLTDGHGDLTFTGKRFRIYAFSQSWAISHGLFMTSPGRGDIVTWVGAFSVWPCFRGAGREPRRRERRLRPTSRRWGDDVAKVGETDGVSRFLRLVADGENVAAVFVARRHYPFKPRCIRIPFRARVPEGHHREVHPGAKGSPRQSASWPRPQISQPPRSRANRARRPHNLWGLFR